MRYDGYQLRRAHEMEGPRLIAYHVLWSAWNADKPLPSMDEWYPLITDEGQQRTRKEREDEEYNRLLDIMAAAEKIYLN